MAKPISQGVIGTPTERLPREQFGAVGCTDGYVRALLEPAEFNAVHTARLYKQSWAAIAVALGVSRQSAWKKWRDVDG